MKKYKVTIIETLEREVPVIATSAESAADIVERKYRNEDILLDAEDYLDTEFFVEIFEDEDENEEVFSAARIKQIVLLSYSPTKWSEEEMYTAFLETYKRLNDKPIKMSFSEYKELRG